MANKAFAYDAAQRRQKIKPVDIVAALRDRGTAECVVVNIENDHDRRTFGRSAVEITGDDWRKAHGFGRPFSCGNGRVAERQRQKRRMAKRRLQKRARIATRLFDAGKRLMFRLFGNRQRWPRGKLPQ